MSTAEEIGGILGGPVGALAGKAASAINKKLQPDYMAESKASAANPKGTNVADQRLSIDARAKMANLMNKQNQLKPSSASLAMGRKPNPVEEPNRVAFAKF